MVQIRLNTFTLRRVGVWMWAFSVTTPEFAVRIAPGGTRIPKHAQPPNKRSNRPSRRRLSVAYPVIPGDGGWVHFKLF